MSFHAVLKGGTRKSLEGSGNMTATVIIALFAGAILAQRFRIFILVPLMLLAACAAGIAVFISATGGWYLFVSVIAAAVGLQFGYLAGAALRSWWPATSEKPEDAKRDDKNKSGALPVH